MSKPKPTPAKKAPSALLDDDEPVVVVADFAAVERKVAKSLLADDDDVVEVKVTSVPAVSKKKEKAPPPVVECPVVDLAVRVVYTSPDHAFLIMSGLDKSWSDLLCYSLKLHTVMHMKREDLAPRDSVNLSISNLQSLRP